MTDIDIEVTVVGDDLCGKSTLCKRLQLDPD